MYKVSFVGGPGWRIAQRAPSFLSQSIEYALGAHVTLTRPQNCDLLVVYPYAPLFSSRSLSNITRVMALLASKLRPRTDPLRWLIRNIYHQPKRARILVVSHENLDRPEWSIFGKLLAASDIPRCTFWPKSIDPGGFRLPYWWAYVAWPELTHAFAGRPRDVSRLGDQYDLEGLMSPLPLGPRWSSRKNAAVLVSRHTDFPRRQILDLVRKAIDVDYFPYVPWGLKRKVLSQYRYCVCPENSSGYGYETEKVPDAWLSGCVPIGYIRNSFSDFNSRSVFFDSWPLNNDPLEPLLKSRPNFQEYIEYLVHSLTRRD